MNLETTGIEPRPQRHRTRHMSQCDRFGNDQDPGAHINEAMPFDQFEVIVADTEALRDATFALRHEVYCKELGYEPVRADGLERDAYDEHARHYLVAHVPSGAWAGCVRIVFAGHSADRIGLPFEEARLSLPDQVTVPRAALGEISRLTVAPKFRQGDQPRLKSAALYTALTAVAATAENGLSSAVCMMKPRLRDQLGSYGIRFTQLSEIVDYHGRRALFHMSPRVTCLEIRPELQAVLTAIRSAVQSRHDREPGRPPRREPADDVLDAGESQLERHLVGGEAGGVPLVADQDDLLRRVTWPQFLDVPRT